MEDTSISVNLCKKNTMIHYWNSKEHKALHKAKGFSDLLPIALTVIDRMPDPVAMVSGPVSTGGKDSIEANLHLLSAAISLLYDKGISVFDQTPFDDIMQDMKQSWNKKGYCMPLLEDFYKPILESGKIQTVYFLPGWKSSFGAKWEYKQCQKLGIEALSFPQEWLNEL